MRYLFWISICLCITCWPGTPTPGQERNILTGLKRDTSYVFTLLRQAKQISLSQPDSAILLAKEALRISRQMNNSYGIGHSLLDLGTYYYNNKKDYQTSRTIFYEAIPYCLSYDKLLVRLYENIGNTYVMHGKIDSALRYFYKSLSMLKKTTDSALLLNVYGNISGALAYNRQSNQALFYLKPAMQLADLLKDTPALARNYLTMGLVHLGNKKDSDAVNSWKTTLALSRGINDKSNMSYAYFYIGMTMGKHGDLKKAKAYLDSAAWAEPVKAAQNVFLQSGMGAYYQDLKNYPMAIAAYTKAIRAMGAMGLINNQPDLYYDLAKCYYQSGNKDSAYKYLKAYADIRDSLLGEKQINTINQLEVKYRTSEKDKELAQKQLIILGQQSKLKQKNLWISIITLSTLLIAALVFFIFQSYRRKQQLAILHLQQGQLKALMQGEEMERRRIARELHDGIGSLISAAKLHLSNINRTAIASKDTYENGLNLLDDAYNELRLTSHNLVPEQLLDEGLINAVQAYCERISQPPLVNISFLHFGMEPKLSAEKALSVYRIIQELVQNAYKHGSASKIAVQISYYDQLYISVEDNGTGLPAEKESDPGKENNGIGLQNLKERIKLIGGSMEIDNRPGMGVTIYVEVHTD